MKRIYFFLWIILTRLTCVHAMTSQVARLAPRTAGQLAKAGRRVTSTVTLPQSRAWVTTASPVLAEPKGIPNSRRGELAPRVISSEISTHGPLDDLAGYDTQGALVSESVAQRHQERGEQSNWSGNGSTGQNGNKFKWLNPRDSVFWGTVFQIALASWIAQGLYKKHELEKREQSVLDAQRADEQGRRNAQEVERLIIERKKEEAKVAALNILEGVRGGADYSLMVEKNPQAISFPVQVILDNGASLDHACIRYQINYLKRRMLELGWRKDVEGQVRVMHAISQLSRYLQGESVQAIKTEPLKRVPAAKSLIDDIGDKLHPKQYIEERKAVAIALEQPQRIWYGSQEKYEEALSEWKVVYQGLWARYLREIMDKQEMMQVGLVDNNRIQHLAASYLERELLLNPVLNAETLKRCLENSSPAVDWVLVRAIGNLTATGDGKEQFFAELVAHPDVIEPTEKALRSALQRYDLFMWAHPAAPQSEGFERARAVLRIIESNKKLYGWWNPLSWWRPQEPYYDVPKHVKPAISSSGAVNIPVSESVIVPAQDI